MRAKAGLITPKILGRATYNAWKAYKKIADLLSGQNWIKILGEKVTFGEHNRTCFVLGVIREKAIFSLLLLCLTEDI